MIHDTFAELEKQWELIASCTVLCKELSDHFSSIEHDLKLKADSLRSKSQTLDLSTQQTLDSLHRHEESIDRSVDITISNLDSLRSSSLAAIADDPTIRSLCKRMDPEGFLNLVVSKRKDSDFLRTEIPVVLSECVDPSNLVLDAVPRVFPVDKRKVKSSPDVAWACVLILEGLVPALADLEERARAMVAKWKSGMEGRGGVGSLKPTDVHSFLQLLVTFRAPPEQGQRGGVREVERSGGRMLGLVVVVELHRTKVGGMDQEEEEEEK